MHGVPAPAACSGGCANWPFAWRPDCTWSSWRPTPTRSPNGNTPTWRGSPLEASYTALPVPTKQAGRAAQTMAGGPGEPPALCFISTAAARYWIGEACVRAIGRRERRHLPYRRDADRRDPDVHRRPAKNVIAGRACARSCGIADGTSVRGRRSVYPHGKLVAIAAARTPGQSDRQRTN